MADLEKTQMFVPAMRDRSVVPDARLIRSESRADSPDMISLTGDGLSLACDSAGNLSESNSEASDFKVFQISGAWGIQALTSNVPFAVNNKQMTLSFLKSGDDINFGDTHYIFRWANESENAEIPSASPAVPQQPPVAQKAESEQRIRHFEMDMPILVLEIVIIVTGVLALWLKLI